MQSMTGFGRAEKAIGGTHYTVEVKSVNHRYLDARFRLPPTLSLYEIPLTEALRSKFERGSFEVLVKQKVLSEGSTIPGSTRFVVDETAAESLIEACDWLHYKFKTAKIPALEVLALVNKVFIPIEESQDPKELFGQMKPLFDTAFEALRQMREAEGKRLKTLLSDGIGELTRVADRLAELAPLHPAKIQEKLKNRLAQWNLGASVEPQRLEWEVAFFADRSDITEEIDRLRAHAKEFAATLEGDKAVGRKLDFLTQELHREINTVASKADAIEVTRLAVEGKSVIEKLREQVQNVE